MYMSHPVTPNGFFCHFNAALVTNDTFILNLLILTAMTFPVLAGSEDPLAEKSVIFRL